MALLAAWILVAAQEPPAPAKQEHPAWTYGGGLFTNLSALGGTTDARRSMEEEGWTTEFSAHATGYLSPRLTVRARACIGCHGLEVDEAYAEYRFSESIAARLGRFNVPFGGFAGRHDPSINEGNSKPVPYAMGLMPRGVAFNYGVVPAPLVDNGLALSARLAPGLDAELFLVRGLKGFTTDFDYPSSRDYPDNNGEPAGGARVVGGVAGVTLGASIMMGRYDVDHELGYTMAAAEAEFSLGPLRLRGEYLRRETEYLKTFLPRDEDEFVKDGYTLQAVWTVDDRWSVHLSHDALYVKGVYLSPGGPVPLPSPVTTGDESDVLRVEGGVSWRPHAGVQIKLSAEYWDFLDFEDTWVFHAGAGVHF